jgi:hypothetical protein
MSIGCVAVTPKSILSTLINIELHTVRSVFNSQLLQLSPLLLSCSSTTANTVPLVCRFFSPPTLIFNEQSMHYHG